MENTKAGVYHNIILESRRKMSISGVTDVDKFDEDIVHIYTSLGELTIKGSDLHVSDLSTDSGEMNIEGQIDSVVYGEAKTPLSFLAKIFK
ncbi:MAG: YabP/YqfC family sporulation protein [Ruminococcus sp.]|jgi:sporulation protein YabP|nr:YabP/YqfC family sporulation protein [Ruminococcus sp.]